MNTFIQFAISVLVFCGLAYVLWPRKARKS